MARILAIHAHPDDIEFLAGGAMTLLSALGHALTIVTFTPGDCGSKEQPPDEIAAVRRGEAAGAAALVGARYLCLEFRDLAIFSDDSTATGSGLGRQTMPETLHYSVVAAVQTMWLAARAEGLGMGWVMAPAPIPDAGATAARRMRCGCGFAARPRTACRRSRRHRPAS